MEPNDLFYEKRKHDGTAVYLLRDGRLVRDKGKMLPYLDERGDQQYAWELLVDTTRGDMLSERVQIVFLVLVLPFIGLWGLAQIPVRTVQWVTMIVSLGAFAVLFGMTITRRIKAFLRSEDLLPLGRSIDRFNVFNDSLQLSGAAACLAAAIVNPVFLLSDDFTNAPENWYDELGFISYQLARVITLDSIEIANASWTDVAADSASAIALLILLNFLIASGVIAIVVHAWNDMKRREEPIFGTTYDLLRHARHEPTPGNKKVRLLGPIETGRWHMALHLREFVSAYEAQLIPTSLPSDDDAGPYDQRT